MTNPNVDPIEAAEFWRFWKWQYTSRSPNYISAYEKWSDIGRTKLEVSGPIPGGITDDGRYSKESELLEYCHNEYGWQPIKNPDDGSNSHKILLDVFNRKLNKKVYGFIPYKYEVDIWGLKNGNIRYTIDFNKPLEQVLAEVKNIYQRNKLDREAVSTGIRPHPGEFDKIHAEMDGYFLNNSDEGFRMDDQIRAIGLWLWDFVKHENVKVRGAIRELNKIINLEQAGFGSIETETIKQKPNTNPESTFKRITRYFNLTKECIEQMKVLSMPS